MAKSNLMKLAKGTETKTKPQPKKTEAKKVVEKPLTPEQERDIKAKAKVDELLQHVDLIPKTSQDDLLEVVPENEVKGTEWLEEQVSKLGEENEKLRAEAAIAKEDYAKLYQQVKGGVVPAANSTDGLMKVKVTQLFNELQAAYFSMGMSPNTGEPNLIIYPVAFMNKLILFFPFLQNEKRF
jgi:hypothetical protein